MPVTAGAEKQELRMSDDKALAALAAIVEHIPYKDKGDGNAPWHGHEVPGVWDRNGGPMDGRVCDWCKAWSDAVAVVSEAKQG